MAFRFRRTIKIAPGLRLNIGKRGVSVSAGVRGASVTAGRGGLYGNLGLPGTGLSVREKIGGFSGSSRGRGATSNTGAAGANVEFALKDDGSVELRDPSGNPLPEAIQRRAKREGRRTVEAWLQQNCTHWNEGIREILELHLRTPAPEPTATFQPRSFEVPRPARLQLVKSTLFTRMIRSRRERLEIRNRHLADQHDEEARSWEQAKADHELSETVRGVRFTSAQQGSAEALSEVLEEELLALDWPRETSVSFEVREDGSVWLDVDLPEIEDLPGEEASVAKRGLKINVKQKSDAQRRREYMTHVHGVGFRLVGEIFHFSPRIPRIVISGYSQRPDPATGQVRDDYLFSAVIRAETWGAINFRNLGSLNLPECYERFDLRRKMTKTGIFKPIEPFQPEELVS